MEKKTTSEQRWTIPFQFERETLFQHRRRSKIIDRMTNQSVEWINLDFEWIDKKTGSVFERPSYYSVPRWTPSQLVGQVRAYVRSKEVYFVLQCIIWKTYRLPVREKKNHQEAHRGELLGDGSEFDSHLRLTSKLPSQAKEVRTQPHDDCSVRTICANTVCHTTSTDKIWVDGPATGTTCCGATTIGIYGPTKRIPFEVSHMVPHFFISVDHRPIPICFCHATPLRKLRFWPIDRLFPHRKPHQRPHEWIRTKLQY